MNALSQKSPIVIERHYATPVEKLWRALTTPELIAEWLMPNTLGALALGSRFEFRIPATEWWNGITESEILAVEPMTHLKMTFEPTGEDAKRAPKLTVSFTLTPAADGVHLRLEIHGFADDQLQLRQGAEMAWTGMLDRLTAASKQAL